MPEKFALRSRGVWGAALALLAAVAALEPALLEAVLAPVFAIAKAAGFEIGAETQERIRAGALGAIALAGGLLALLSRLRPSGEAITFRPGGGSGSAPIVLLAAALAASGGLACASTPAQRLYAATELAAGAQAAATSEIALRCSRPDLGPGAAEDCARMTEANAQAQTALEAALEGAHAARAEGDDLEAALEAVRVALCRVYSSFPGLSPPAGAAAVSCGAEAVR